MTEAETLERPTSNALVPTTHVFAEPPRGHHPSEPPAQPTTTMAATVPANGDTVARFADTSVKSLLLMNGGAAIALLTFVGHAEKSLASAMAPALSSLGWGAALAVVAGAAAYVAQAVRTKGADPFADTCYGGSLRVVALTAGLVSTGAFLHAMTITSRALA